MTEQYPPIDLDAVETLSPEAAEALAADLRKAADVYSRNEIDSWGGASVLAADIATAGGMVMRASAKYCHVQAYASGVSATLGAARYRRVAAQPSHDLKFRSADRFLPNGTVSSGNGGWWEIDEKDIDVTMAGASAAAASNTTAIGKAIKAAAALGVGCVALGAAIYLCASTISVTAASKATVMIGSDVKIKGTAALAGKLFDLRGDNIVVCGRGTLDGKDMPASPVGEDGASLAAYDLLTIIGDNTTVRELYFYCGETAAESGADSHVFLAGDNLLVENTRHKGAKDLAVYFTDRQTTGKRESFGRVIGSSFDECSATIAGKRGFAHLLVDGIYAKNGVNGVFCGETEVVGTTLKYLTVVNSTFVGYRNTSIIARVSNWFKLENNSIIDSTAVNLMQIQGSSYGIVRGNQLMIDPAVYVSPATQRGILITSRAHTDDITYHSRYNLIAHNKISGVYNPIFEFDANQDFNNYINNPVHGHSDYGRAGVRLQGPNSKLILDGAGLPLIIGSNEETVLSSLRITGAAGSVRRIAFQTAGSDRWHIQADGSEEAGGNAGSDFEIVRRRDDGSSYSTPLSISRVTGIVRIGDALRLPDFTVATVPSPSARSQCVIYVSDGSSNRHLATADGGNWRWGDGTIIS